MYFRCLICIQEQIICGKVLEGPIGDEFLEAFQGSGILALSWYDAGARSFYNAVKPIEKLEDIKGMTIRVQESELMSDTVRALGSYGRFLWFMGKCIPASRPER